MTVQQISVFLENKSGSLVKVFRALSQAGIQLTLVPLVDLSGSSAKYIFLRALPYSATSHFQNYSGTLRFMNEQYYGGIPNHVKNRIEENNK